MITNIQSPGIVRTVYSNIFKEILGYSGIMMQIPSLFHTLNQRRNGKPPLLFLKIKRKCPDFGKKGPDYEAPLLKIPSSPLLFAKPSILNVSQCSGYVCVSITAQQFVQSSYLMYVLHQTHSEILHIPHSGFSGIYRHS